MPIPIQRLEAKAGEIMYLPHMRVDAPDFIAKVERRQNEFERLFQKPLTELDDVTYKEKLKSSPDFVEFARGVSERDGWEVPPTATQFRRNLALAKQTSDADLPLVTTSRSALERTKKIPDWVRETNTLRLFQSWATNNIRHSFLRRDISKLQNYSRILAKAGDNVGADYINTLLQDTIGGARPRTFAALTRGTADALRLAGARRLEAARAQGSKEPILWRIVRESPDILSGAMNQIYANTLGFSTRAALRNLTQTYTMLAPELGSTPYANYLVTVGLGRSTVGWRTAMRELDRLGLKPDVNFGEAVHFLENGIREGRIASMSREAIRKYAHVSMALYRLSDDVNRSITYHAAQRLAEDLIANGGTGSAGAALARLPRLLRQEAATYIQRGDQRKLGERLAQHLISTTQFQYNRFSMSEMGRAMGPLFSIFSKWPSEVAGDILGTLRGEGRLLPDKSVRLLQKYLMPVAALGGMQSLLLGPPEEMSDRDKMLYGSKGLVDWAPLPAVTPLIKGEVATPPAVDALLPLIGMVSGLAEGDEERTKAAGLKAGWVGARTFLPGMSVFRLLLDDIPTLATDYREEPNLLKRFAE